VDIKAAIRYLKRELRGLNDAIHNFEAIVSEQYAGRESRAKEKVSGARHRKLKGKERVMDRFVVLPPHELNPDAYLWLQ
jgi:hypothetical protein